MKFLPLLWKGIWRKRGRTFLTLLSIFNAFLLLGVLNSFTSGLGNAAAEAGADTLITHSKVSMFEPLPIGLVEKIKSVPGVQSATPLIIFPVRNSNQTQGPMALGAKPRDYFAANPELNAPEDAVTAMEDNRSGAIIGPGLAARYGWKVGERVPLTSDLWLNRDGSNIWPVTIVGTYKPANRTVSDNVMILNYDYIDEGRMVAKGTANWFSVKIKDPSQIPSISSAINGLFSNSPYETTTVTTSQLAQDQVTQIGNIGFVVNAIAGAVFFSLLFYVGMVMIQAGRERLPEFATLKALGFTDKALFALILSEALAICLFAALLGLLAAAAIFPITARIIGMAIVSKGVISEGLLLAVGLALLGGLSPALLVMRVSVVEGLARKTT